MNNLLYYPYINVPKTDWLIRARYGGYDLSAVSEYQGLCPEMIA